VYELTSQCMNPQMAGQMKGRIGGWVDEWTNECRHVVNRWVVSIFVLRWLDYAN
jgi:hypothetical protein